MTKIVKGTDAKILEKGNIYGDQTRLVDLYINENDQLVFRKEVIEDEVVTNELVKFGPTSSSPIVGYILNQAGASAPDKSVQVNQIGDSLDIVFTRLADGHYKMRSESGIFDLKFILMFNPSYAGYITYEKIDGKEVEFSTYDLSEVKKDDRMVNTMLSIQFFK